MSRRTKLLLAAATAALALAAGAGSAAAEDYEISPAGSMTASSLGSITFRSPLVTVTCSLTMSGTLESAASAYGPLGSITSVRGTETCRGATVRADATPWTLLAGAPLGTLPNGLTGTNLELYNGGFLFDINVLGIEAKCDYLGVVPTLTALSGTNPYRTGLLTIQTRGQRLVLDASLDTSGLCPSGSEVSLSGTLSATTETVTARPFAIAAEPEVLVTFFASEESVITFRNVSGGTLRIRRFLFTGSSQFTLVEQNCLIGQLTEMGANRTCTARVRWVNPGGRQWYIARIRIHGDPGETWFGGATVRG